jgi:hypothetical protein
MESDEYPDPRDGLPRGVFEFGGSDAPVGPQIAALKAMMNGDDPDLARAAAASLAERYRASNIRYACVCCKRELGGFEHGWFGPTD